MGVCASAMPECKSRCGRPAGQRRFGYCDQCYEHVKLKHKHVAISSVPPPATAAASSRPPAATPAAPPPAVVIVAQPQSQIQPQPQPPSDDEKEEEEEGAPPPKQLALSSEPHPKSSMPPLSGADSPPQIEGQPHVTHVHPPGGPDVATTSSPSPPPYSAVVQQPPHMQSQIQPQPQPMQPSMPAMQPVMPATQSVMPLAYQQPYPQQPPMQPAMPQPYPVPQPMPVPVQQYQQPIQPVQPAYIQQPVPMPVPVQPAPMFHAAPQQPRPYEPANLNTPKAASAAPLMYNPPSFSSSGSAAPFAPLGQPAPAAYTSSSGPQMRVTSPVMKHAGGAYQQQSIPAHHHPHQSSQQFPQQSYHRPGVSSVYPGSFATQPQPAAPWQPQPQPFF